MIEEDRISELLEALSDERTQKALSRDITPLKGVRGVPFAELAKLIGNLFKTDGVNLHDDGPALDRLFGVAWEDGMVSIGLVAAGLLDDAEAGLELGLDWLTRLDDPLTADALGALVLGPAIATTGQPVQVLIQAAKDTGTEEAARAVVSAGMAWTTAPVEGPSAAALRERVGERKVRFVEGALNDGLSALADAFIKNESPSVRKALRRVLKAWGKDDPAAVVAWADRQKGGIPKMLREEVDPARRRAARLA